MSAVATPKQKNVLKIDWSRAGLGTRLDKDIARDFGVPRRQVAKIRARLGIPSYTEQKKKAAKPATAPAPDPTATTSVIINQPVTPVTHIVANSPALSSPPEPPKKEARKKLVNHIAVVLDKSGSMGSFQSQALDAFKNLSATIQQNSRSQDQETRVSLFTFANRVSRDILDQDPSMLSQYQHYHCSGMTALLDGVGDAITYLKGLPDANDDNVSFLVVVITDGEENASLNFDSHTLPKLMKEVQLTDRWTLTFQVPPGHKNAIKAFGIPSDNIREWEQTQKGFVEAEQKTSAGIGTFYSARASGQKSVQTFYTDLSKLKVSDVKKKLDDISDRFKEYTVEKEASVKEFVEAKTKKPFVIGAAYYLLMKKEEIQPHKQVLIREKRKRAVWGGDSARDLIGLPSGVTAKVTPGNHSGYDIFVQSKSVNRILPRGTVVLVDVSKTTDDTPTWDHTKVAK